MSTLLLFITVKEGNISQNKIYAAHQNSTLKTGSIIFAVRVAKVSQNKPNKL